MKNNNDSKTREIPTHTDPNETKPEKSNNFEPKKNNPVNPKSDEEPNTRH